MMQEEIVLDKEAERLYQELGGIETKGKKKEIIKTWRGFSEALQEEEKGLDVRRILLIEFVHLISGYFIDTRLLDGVKSDDDGVNEVLKILEKLGNMPGHEGTILVRFRGFTSGKETSAKLDYVIIFGNITVDSTIVNAIVRRQGVRTSHLGARLLRAFEVFSSHGINTLYLKIPGELPEEWNSSIP